MKKAEPKRSKGVNSISAKRRLENRERRKVMEEAFGDRRNWRCSLRDSPGILALTGPCMGPVNGHEIVPRGRGGSITASSNIILVCNYHNEWISAHPKEAHTLGLLKHSWEA